MSYDETLAARIREALSDRDDVIEKKMFGGLCFMVGGAMCCGLTKSDFMVRVGPDQHAAALEEPHARPMDFTGRAMRGWSTSRACRAAHARVAPQVGAPRARVRRVEGLGLAAVLTR